MHSLNANGHAILAIGIRTGQAGPISISTKKPVVQHCYAVSVYLQPFEQKAYCNYIVKLKPKRLIFNPGTENNELAKIAEDAGIEVLNDCTLMMLAKGTFY
jgi:predicted CoA-binding protein